MSRVKYSHDARQRDAAKAIDKSYQHAQKLDTIGMDVILTEDSGQLTRTKLTSLPWTLAHGAWVVCVEGKRGGYDCARISPAPAVSAAMGTRMERGGA